MEKMWLQDYAEGNSIWLYWAKKQLNSVIV